MTPSRKQAQSEGGGFPQWLAELGVRPGGFYIETKARLVHAMKNKAWQDEPRVWACLALHTMAFQQELAVRMEGGALVPLRQVDIARETGIDVRKVQRAVQNLEKQGSVARQGQVKGEVRIICYAVPRPPKKEADVETTSAPSSIYDGLPDDLAVWLRKFKFGAPETEKLNEAVQEAREVELHVQRLRELCKRGHSANRATVAILLEPRSRATKMDPARGVENSKMDPARQPESTPRADAHIRKKELKELTTRESVGRSGALETTSDKTDRPTDFAVQSIRKAIEDSGICAKLKDVPSRTLCEQIAKTMNGNPAEYLKNRIHLRFDDITGLGMLKGLAKDVVAAAGMPISDRLDPVSGTDEVKALALRNLQKTGKLL